MIIAEINMLSVGSTGKIMFQIAESARKRGHEVYTFSPYDYINSNLECPENHTYFGTYLERRIHNLIGRILGCNGCLSRKGTKKLIRDLETKKVDIVHLHNIHNYCIHIPTLFNYLYKKNIKVIWTLHDCWSFTGHCPHFEMVECQKWKYGCKKCIQYREYPQSLIDNSGYMYRMKKKYFTKLDELFLVTPSKWLADCVADSYLKKYPIKVINNGINLEVFKPTKSDFRKRNFCEEKKIILGVAFEWGKKKGLDVFIELAKRLDDNYQIILVGTNEKIDEILPNNIISIHKTDNQQQMAEIYTAADVFVNPTREDTYPTVNLESLACGTPVITFNTGGSPECIDLSCGVVVEKNDIDSLEMEIKQVLQKGVIRSSKCCDRAKMFDAKNKYDEYVNLYGSI